MSAVLLSKTLLGVVMSGLLLIAPLGLAGDSDMTRTIDGESCRSLPEPPLAAAFIQAERNRDLKRASLVTSPLFRAELERRGRGAEWPLLGLWTEAAPKLEYAYLGAFEDGNGFTYTLYSARPREVDRPDAPTSLWRIDLDPRRRVIWGELARLFGQPSIEVVCGSAGHSHNSLTAPPLIRLGNGLAEVLPLPGHREQSQVALGIRSAAGDAYIALRPHSDEPTRIAFAQLDTSGELGPSYWSFGQPIPTRDAEGHEIPPRPFGLSHLSELSDSDAQALQEYLDALAWSPLETGLPR